MDFSKDKKILTDSDINKISEFIQYDETVVTKSIRTYFNSKRKYFPRTTDGLLFAFFKEFYSVYKSIDNPYQNLKDKYNDFSVTSLNNSVFTDLLDKLIKCYDNLINCFFEAINEKDISKRIIPHNYAEDCIDAYYDLVRKTIFNNKNNNLRNSRFRHCEYICDLVLPDRKDKMINQKQPQLGYNVSFIDAFNLDIMLMIIRDVHRFEEEYPHHPDVSGLFDIKLSLLCSMADRAFVRYIHLDDETFRITLNRQTSLIVARPFSKRSSLIAVKPIRLFEKIKSYIGSVNNTIINEYKAISDIKIVIIGHSEKSDISCYNYDSNKNNSKETEIFDLCTALYNWVINNQTIKININIEYIVNWADWYTCFGKQRFTSNKYDKHGKLINEVSIVELGNDQKSVNCRIIPMDYEYAFDFTHNNLKSIIENSNLTFIIDPAFLYLEEYELLNRIPLDKYSAFLNDKSFVERKLWNEYCHLDFDYKNGHSSATDIMFMNTQLNRLMASSSMKAGEICRVFNDSLIETIKKTVQENSRFPSVVYIFSSETVGLKTAKEASYPLVRSEQYNGKTMNIYQFCNYSVPRLKCSNDKEFSISIPLWSTIKYISLNYAFETNTILKCLSKRGINKHLTPLESLETLKGLITKLTIKLCDDSNFKLTYCFGWKNSSKEFLINKSEQQDELAKYYCNLIHQLFDNVLFTSSVGEHDMFGNALIRIGFGMNIYSLAKNVDEIYFWHHYVKACRENDFSKFLINSSQDFNYESEEHENESLISGKCEDYFFMDKMIYATLLEQLETSHDTTPIFSRMILSMNEKPYIGKSREYTTEDGYYQTSTNSSSVYSFPKALMDICDKMNDNNSELYKRLATWAANYS